LEGLLAKASAPPGCRQGEDLLKTTGKPAASRSAQEGGGVYHDTASEAQAKVR